MLCRHTYTNTHAHNSQNGFSADSYSSNQFPQPFREIQSAAQALPMLILAYARWIGPCPSAGPAISWTPYMNYLRCTHIYVYDAALCGAFNLRHTIRRENIYLLNKLRDINAREYNNVCANIFYVISNGTLKLNVIVWLDVSAFCLIAWCVCVCVSVICSELHVRDRDAHKNSPTTKFNALR